MPVNAKIKRRIFPKKVKKDPSTFETIFATPSRFHSKNIIRTLDQERDNSSSHASIVPTSKNYTTPSTDCRSRHSSSYYFTSPIFREDLDSRQSTQNKRQTIPRKLKKTFGLEIIFASPLRFHPKNIIRTLD